MINEHSKGKHIIPFNISLLLMLVLTSKPGVDSHLLHHLPYTVEAPFNSYTKQDSSTCLPNTRVGLLKEIYSWVNSEDERYIFWLNGLASTGKSTIARTVARRYFDQKRLGASFFFSRGRGDVGHAGKFVTSIAVQLAHSAPSFRRYISEAVEEQINIANHSLRDQWRQLVLRPLLRLDKRLSPSSYLLIVDALDECDNEDHIRTILQLLAEARSLTTVRLRVFLTSRPEIPIRHRICAILQAEHQDFVLHNIQPTIVNHDISLFLDYNLGMIGQEWTLGPKWPGEEVLRQLVLYASGLFIWAAIHSPSHVLCPRSLQDIARPRNISASSQAGLSLQYARAGTWSGPEANRLLPAMWTAAQALKIEVSVDPSLL
jgi:NACHT domain